MSNNPYEAPQSVEHRREPPRPAQIPTFREVLGVLLFQAVFLILSALILDGGRMFLVAIISCIAMWVILGLRWLRFRKRA